ncbi:KH domain-containing, RNA-binding, signal transduction-associated protein 2 [Zootermopsis nevadensis]|uniref:KH domain-containing, RNA-binding, signal transduction-associated protein 2 n=1 Tax=Zootermopsis nevadensis TaxID=136037 RepID=A0A067RWH9_ZOONE|nr:KH domain-containing, RNA-binding, signal transduction-associated protein 2 [Zootermopsis nevadensis]
MIVLQEEELRCSGDPKFSHLSDDLHIEITAFAPPAEAHARIAYALAEVRRFLVPDYNDEIRQEQMWEIHILKTQRCGRGELLPVGDSTASSSSTGSMSPCTPPLPVAAESPPPTLPTSHGLVLAPQHPALRGVEPRTSIAGATVPSVGAGSGPPTQLLCRKRPLLPGGGTRLAMSPTKRTVLSILARARAAQAKDLPEYHHITNGYNQQAQNGIKERG